MTAVTVEADRPEVEAVGPPQRRRRRPWIAVAVVAALVAAFWLGSRSSPDLPADGSPEAGFTRDMAVHHAQAVEMAELIRPRSADPALRIMAADIALTQQAQIGQMAGWLETWGLLPTGRKPAMAWMGHGSGAMPGMATPAEVARIGQAPPGEADTLFLQAMIRHHQGGVVMAKGVLERSHRPEVRRLASKIVAAQESEIQAMTEMLRAT
jgi:uncharacterized protein (DUF305 family)